MPWFKRKPDPKWYAVWTHTANWIYEDSQHQEHCFYTIEFSPILKEYRLIAEGYKPKEHQFYGVAKEKLVEVNKELLNNNPDLWRKEEPKGPSIDGKLISELSESQCNIYLMKCMKEEKYEYARLIEERLQQLKEEK